MAMAMDQGRARVMAMGQARARAMAMDQGRAGVMATDQGRAGVVTILNRPSIRMEQPPRVRASVRVRVRRDDFTT